MKRAVSATGITSGSEFKGLSTALALAILLTCPFANQAVEIISPGVERSLMGSPASPEFGMPEIPLRREMGPATPVLPPVERKPDDTRLSRQQTIYIDHILITGYQRPELKTLEQMVKPYAQRKVTLTELLSLRDRISRYFLSKGFINTGAMIPDQDISNGIVEIKIIKGRLTRINTLGQSALSSGYIENRIAKDLTSPLDIKALSENLQILQQHPVINSLKSELRPGLKAGEAILDVLVKEGRPYSLKLNLSNQHAPSVGEYTLNGEFTHYSLTHHGDRLQISTGLSKGLHNAEFTYSLPVNLRDTSIDLHYKMDSTVVVEAPFQDLDISGINRSASIGVTHPILNSTSRQLALSLGLEVKKSRTKLLGVPFDFSSGSVNGETKTSVLFLGADWLKRETDQVIAVRSTFRYGVGILNPTEHSDLADNHFLSWLGQIQMAKRINAKGHQIITKAELQLANNTLLTSEKYALGGMKSIRGYRTNQLVRDNGLLLSAEYHVPVRSDEAGTKKDQILVFADYGMGWDRGYDNDAKNDLLGIGIGYIWRPSRNLQGELYLGKSLERVESTGDSIQDNGIYFNLIVDPG